MGIGSWLKSKAGAVADEAEDLGSSAINGVEDVGSSVAAGVESAASSVEDGIVETSGSVYQGAQNAYHEAKEDVETVESGGEKAWDYAKEGGEKVWNATSPFYDKAIDYGSELAKDAEKGVADAAPTLAKDAAEAGEDAKWVPGVGTLINGLGASYHAAASAYDFASGNRDGGVMQAGQTVGNVLGMIPGVDAVVGGIDMGLGTMGTALQVAAPGSADNIPTSTADVISGLAVGATNAIWGQDTGKTTATRRGEVGAGMRGLANGALNAIGGGWIPGLGNMVDYAAGDKIEKGAAKADGTVFGTPEDAPATGEGAPNIWQQAGQQAYRNRQNANAPEPEIPLPAPSSGTWAPKIDQS